MSAYMPAWKPKVSVTQAEKDEMLAYVRAVASKDGLALSQLRKPGTSQNLQAVEVVAAALIADGSLRLTYHPSPRGNGGYNLYFLVER